MGHNIGDGFAAHGENNALSRANGVDDLTGLVSKFSYTDLHVRQCSTWPMSWLPNLRK